MPTFRKGLMYNIFVDVSGQINLAFHTPASEMATIKFVIEIIRGTYHIYFGYSQFLNIC